MAVDDQVASGPMETVQRLNKDLLEAAGALDRASIKYFVSVFYEQQEQRIRADAQLRASAEQGEPNALLTWNAREFLARENNIKRAMDSWCKGQLAGRWMQSIVGIGPVLAAGVLSYIDIRRATNPAKLWSYAGMNPNMRWYGREGAAKLVAETLPGVTRQLTADDVMAVAVAAKRDPQSLWRQVRLQAMPKAKRTMGDPATRLEPPEDVVVRTSHLAAVLAKRPWDANFKVLLWKCSQSFVKSSGNENSFYGPLYRQRKAYELANNNMRAVVDGDGGPTRYVVADPGAQSRYAEQAALQLTRKRYGDETDARKWYELGMLPPAHIQARVERWTVKLFVSHVWRVLYEIEYQKPAPDPYPIAILGHSTYIAPPNWPFLDD
jgi:hypothetical protein